jgi:hypothetical protein
MFDSMQQYGLAVRFWLSGAASGDWPSAGWEAPALRLCYGRRAVYYRECRAAWRARPAIPLGGEGRGVWCGIGAREGG